MAKGELVKFMPRFAGDDGVKDSRIPGNLEHG